MNEEMVLTHLVGLRAFTLASIVYLYALAGRGVKLPILGKIRRRVWLPLLSAICMQIIQIVKCNYIAGDTWSWWLCGAIWASVGLQYGLYSGFSYGAGSWLRPLGKGVQRFIVHGVHAAGWCLIPLLTGRWLVFALGVGISAVVGTVLGALNPIPAAEEEGAIGLAEFAYPTFLI